MRQSLHIRTPGHFSPLVDPVSLTSSSHEYQYWFSSSIPVLGSSLPASPGAGSLSWHPEDSLSAATPSVTSTLPIRSQEAAGGSHDHEPEAFPAVDAVRATPGVDDAMRVLERDREWMVDALCCDDELWRLPARDPEADPLPGFLLLDRPTRAKRANPASLRGSVELLPVTFLSTSGSCSGSTGRESQESRR